MRAIRMLDGHIAATEPGPDAPFEVLAEHGVQLAELLDCSANAASHGEAHALHIRRHPARAAAEAGGGAQLVAELLDLGARGGGSSRVVAPLGVLELRTQLGKTAPVVGAGAVIEHRTGVAQPEGHAARQERVGVDGHPFIPRSRGWHEGVECLDVQLFPRMSEQMAQQRKPARVTDPNRRPLIGDAPHVAFLLEDGLPVGPVCERSLDDRPGPLRARRRRCASPSTSWRNARAETRRVARLARPARHRSTA